MTGVQTCALPIYTPKFGAENPNTGTKASAEDKAALQKKIEDIKEATYSAKAARAGKDIGKPGKMFSKIAKKAGEKYGSEERGKKVAGAVLAKIRAKHMKEEEQIDEVSKGLAKKYAKSAVNDLADRTDPNYGYITDKPDRKSTRLNSSHIPLSRMPSSA